MMNRVDLMYSEGLNLFENGELHAGFALIEEAAKLGSAEAQSVLGNIYDDASIWARDRKKALYWYRKAVRNDSESAAYNLAVLYKNEGNERRTKFWLDRALEMGYENAKNELEAWWEDSGRSKCPLRSAK